MRSSINWRNASPAFRNMFHLVNGLIAWTTITPLYFQGVIAGSEFTVHNAGKLYIYLELAMSPVLGGGVSFLELYNMANAATWQIGECSSYWDVTAAAARYIASSRNFENGYFSRVVASGVANMKFNGYRLNV